jgi:hypothetical protein
MRGSNTALAILFLAAFAVSASAEMVRIPADRDTTLIEDPDGAFSNGAGPVFFAGRTNQGAGSIRRGLLRFDVASALPPQAIVESVTLRLSALSGNPGVSAIRLYRVLADWGEGASFSTGGRGAPSEPGDATWIHTFYDGEFWEYAGGQFVGRASAEFSIDGPGTYEIRDFRPLVTDVRIWTAAPQRNFGWILIGDETRGGSVQPMVSREGEEADLVPELEVTYRVPGAHRLN